VRNERKLFQAYKVTPEGKCRHHEPFEVTQEEALGWERTLNELRNEGDLEQGIHYVVRPATEQESDSGGANH
jgi:hypothetical protein